MCVCTPEYVCVPEYLSVSYAYMSMLRLEEGVRFSGTSVTDCWELQVYLGSEAKSYAEQPLSADWFIKIYYTALIVLTVFLAF